MEVQNKNLRRRYVVSESLLLAIVEFLVLETAFLAQESLLLFLLLTGPLPKDSAAFMDILGKHNRFPMAELHKVKEPEADVMDADEAEDNDDDRDGDDDSSSDESIDSDDLSSEDDSDDGNDDSEVDEDGSSSGEDDDEDDDADDDEDDNDDEDEDEEEDEDEVRSQPPPKKKKWRISSLCSAIIKNILIEVSTY